MGTLRVRNCTIWDVHYWRKLGPSKAVVKPGGEGTYDWNATYTLGVKRENVTPDGKAYRDAVNQNGIYYIVWDSDDSKLKIITEAEASVYPRSPDNKYLSNWLRNHPDWMSKLNGSHTLDKFSIPGTHDSGTKNTGAGVAHTQNFNIATQLEDGIRFLDIRLDGVTKFDDKLVVKHGCILCFLDFEEVLESCSSFLKKNSRETIIMLVDSSGCLFNDIEERFKTYLEKDKFKNLFNLEGGIPTLDIARGKIVLFRRFEIKGSGVMGVDLSKDWEKDKTFSLTTPQGDKFEIEDEYKQHNTPEKVIAVEDNLNKAIANPDDGVMYMTYNSISAGGHTPYQYAWGGTGIDPAMNPSLQIYLDGKTGDRRFGLVILDFYNDKGSQNGITEAVIMSNDGLKSTK
jgi:1-phosphatidylinositol phosphodiesterase